MQHPTPPAEPWTPQSFAQATDIADDVRRRRALQRRVVAMRILTAVLVLAAVAVGATPFVLQWNSSRALSSQAEQVRRQVDGWPYPQAEEALEAAAAYNRDLAASGQPILGEAADPFASGTGGSSASGASDSAAAKDERYQGLLDTGAGIMGSVVIPKIGVNLPIYHGTSEQALAAGAGHLYGTSLPVGGTSTHAVITGHRGLVEAAMFTRLDEMRLGDFFYMEVMGRTLGYRVDRITVIDPDDVSQLRVEEGQDRVTLMTCTPYGVNTQRLLVSGVRVDIPDPAPDPADLHDGRTVGILTALAVALAGWLAWLPLHRRGRFERRRHARDW